MCSEGFERLQAASAEETDVIVERLACLHRRRRQRFQLHLGSHELLRCRAEVHAHGVREVRQRGRAAPAELRDDLEMHGERVNKKLLDAIQCE